MANQVLLVGPTQRRGATGVAAAFETLLEELKSRKILYSLVDLGASGVSKEAGAFDASHAWRTAGLVVSFWRKLPGAQSVYVTIGASRLGFLRDALMIIPSRLLARRVVLHLHGGGYYAFYSAQPSYIRAVIERTLAQADSIIVLDDSLKSEFGFVRRIETKIRVVGNVLPAGLAPDSIDAKHLLEGEPIRILYLSNLIESKGYLDLLAACRILAHDLKIPIRCNFCGDFVRTSVSESSFLPDEAKTNFVDLLREWDLEGVVRYRGLVCGKEKRALLQEAHVLVLPTYYPWEGQPISIIEALAFATPVVATAHRAIPGQVIDGFNGFIVKPQAPNEIAAAVSRLYQDPSLYNQMSRNAGRHYRERFSPEVWRSRIVPLILGTVEGGRSI